MTPWTKRLAIALAVSLGLNLLLVGFWVGREFLRPDPPPRSTDTLAGPLGGGRRASALRGALENRGSELRQGRDAIRKARAQARDALLRSELNPAELERALSNIRMETTRNQQLLHQAIAEAAASASPIDRRELGRALGADGRGSGALGRGRHGGRGLGPDGDGLGPNGGVR